MGKASRVVYTAITNGHAQLSARPDVPDTDFICYSDVPLDRSDWLIRPIEASNQLCPRMQAKFHKVFPPTGYEWSVWLDGSYVLSTDGADLVDDLIRHSPSGFGLHRHNQWDCLYEEATQSMALAKCEDQRAIIEAQALHYEVMGHPKNSGLWAGGLMCRSHSPRVVEIMARWWDELTRWSWRDQLSLAFVLHVAQFRPDDWPWPLFHNPHIHAWAWNPT